MKRADPYLVRPDQTVSLHGTTFPLEYLYRHLLIVGQPGSGKTQCILMPLIRSILAATGCGAEDKATLIIADPKNELAPFIAQALDAARRPDDLIVLKPGTAWYNPLGNPFLSNQNEMVEKIIAFARNTSRHPSSGIRHDPFWDNAQRALLDAVIGAARTLHGPQIHFGLLNRVFRQINRFKSAADAEGWFKGKNLPPEAIQGLLDFLRLPADSTRPCVATSVANTLHFWAHDPLARLTTPSDDTPGIDPFDIVHRGKVLVIGCSGPAFGVSITPLLLSLKEHFFATLLSRDQIEVDDRDHWRLINQTRPVFFIADEFQSYVSPDSTAGELTALDRLRGFKAGYIAATQNLASLHSVLGDAAHATRLISLFSNQAYLANICPLTASQAEHILGKSKIRERQREIRPKMAPPLLLRETKRYRSGCPEGIEITRIEPRVDASTLAAMKTGEFWLRLANGSVTKGRAASPFDAPASIRP
jgi:type IV secretory pathway TraG/TraD family ATPase VirD4